MRVLRWSKRTPNSCSSAETCFPAVDGEGPKRRAALHKVSLLDRGDEHSHAINRSIFFASLHYHLLIKKRSLCN
jgi:hypothetical protein